MYPTFSHMSSYGKTMDKLQQTEISKTLLLCCLPELQFSEEGQLDHMFFSLLLHVKPHGELREWEWTKAVIMLVPGRLGPFNGKRLLANWSEQASSSSLLAGCFTAVSGGGTDYSLLCNYYLL